MTQQYHNLAPEEGNRLLSILGIFEYMFSVTLGTWNTKPVDLELKDDAKPFF